jgi:plasmid maintenance system antidote protein VapI
VIRSFKDKETEKIFNQQYSRKLPVDIQERSFDVSIEMALKLAKYFGTTDKFWINLQTDIEIRNKKLELKRDLDRIHPVSQAS